MILHILRFGSVVRSKRKIVGEYEKIIRATSRRAYEMDLEFTAAQK